MKTHYRSIGPTDLILCQNHLALFVVRPANLPHSDWEAIANEIGAWSSPRYKTLEMRMSADRGSITLGVTGNANPDNVMRELKTHRQEAFQVRV